ncbi:DMT family transporter [Castellaniella daejeonensis]|jgi:drug/metabolite transporter (DMT)-like permease|uniref:DMT family transporter n=1 Tax=Castellaniella daejeonensis TaxID=659013 RepID=A0ABN0TI86_9BURK|nr:DMT family transporter [Castellaniella sp.]HET8702242.1 DMT family transporter [Castellaniella sp.]
MNSRQATTAIHITAVLFGLTGIFGELIQASATLITAGRAAFATVALLLFMARTGHRPVRPARRALPVLLAAGVLLAIHWTTFFVAVKTGGIAVATLGFASFPAFITLFEGFLFKERTRIAEWAVVALVTAGLALVAPSFDFSDRAAAGLGWGVASGLSFALFTLANRKAVGLVPARELACWENGVVVLLTLPWCLAEFTGLRAVDWVWLFMLGVFCTALSHALLVASLARLNARTAGIVIALEPVYAILFAALLFAQYPSVRALAGGTLIIGAIVWSGWRRAAAD